MYKPAYKEAFGRKLKKLAKRNKLMFERVKNKVKQIVENPHSYKPLSNIMKRFRRVRLDSFVLVFSIDEKEKRVWFEDFDHHDKIYKK